MFRTPVRSVAVQRAHRRRVAGQRGNEREDPPGGEGAAVQVEEIDAVVVAQQIGLDGLAVLR